jgi:hypothetical protein
MIDDMWVAATEGNATQDTPSIEELQALQARWPKPDRRVVLLGVRAYAQLKRHFKSESPLPGLGGEFSQYSQVFSHLAGIPLYVKAKLPPDFCDLVEPDDPRLKEDDDGTV